jgi:hypothetical protein
MNAKSAIICRAGLVTFPVLISAGLYLAWAPQISKATPDKPDVRTQLDDLLKAWDKASQNIREIHYTMEWTTEDKLSKEKTARRVEGFVKSHDARVNLKDEKGRLTQVFLCHENVLESYDFENKGKVSLYTTADWWSPDLLSWCRRLLCYDFKVADLKERYDPQLQKEDGNWAYIGLLAKNQTDAHWFPEIQVVLNQKTHLVRQIRIRDFSGTWTTYDYQQVVINPKPSIALEPISKDLVKGFDEIDLVTPTNEANAKPPASK